MAENRANIQAVHWLNSIKNSSEGFDSINAENALALIDLQNRRLKALGASFCQVKKQRDNAWKALEEARKGLETENNGTPDTAGLHYCNRCKKLVQTEELIMGKYRLRICLECGEEI